MWLFIHLMSILNVERKLILNYDGPLFGHRASVLTTLRRGKSVCKVERGVVNNRSPLYRSGILGPLDTEDGK